MALPLEPQTTSLHASPPDATDAEWESLSPAEQITELFAELQHRDGIVEALTERLEKTSEQLDRLRRSGVERGQLSGGGRPDGELSQRQARLTERLEVVLDDWEEVDGAVAIKRLDLRMEQLVDLLRDSVLQPSSGAHSQGGKVAASDFSEEPGADEALAAGGESGANPAVAPVEPEFELVEAPPAISPDEPNVERLHLGLLVRDEYIAYLIREMRKRCPLTHLDWDALASAPEDVKIRLERLEQRLHDELQREELSLSLERARLAREQRELEKVRRCLEQEIRRLDTEDRAPVPPEGEKDDSFEAEGLGEAESSSVWGVFRRKK